MNCRTLPHSPPSSWNWYNLSNVAKKLAYSIGILFIVHKTTSFLFLFHLLLFRLMSFPKTMENWDIFLANKRSQIAFPFQSPTTCHYHTVCSPPPPFSIWETLRRWQILCDKYTDLLVYSDTTMRDGLLEFYFSEDQQQRAPLRSSRLFHCLLKSILVKSLQLEGSLVLSVGEPRRTIIT